MPPRGSVKKSSSVIAKEKIERYFEAVGRRKTAVARIRLFGSFIRKTKEEGGGPSKGGAEVMVNNKPIDKYFMVSRERSVVLAPFAVVGEFFKTNAKVLGGGSHAQAGAVRLGIARALVLMNPDWRSRLKALGFLKRDPRMVERKKYGSRKARRPQQWRKR